MIYIFFAILIAALVISGAIQSAATRLRPAGYRCTHSRCTICRAAIFAVLVLVSFGSVHAQSGTITAHGQFNMGLNIVKGTGHETTVPTTTIQVGNVVYEVDGGRHVGSLPLGTVVDTKYESHRTGARLAVVTPDGKTSKCYVYTQRYAEQH